MARAAARARRPARRRAPLLIGTSLATLLAVTAVAWAAKGELSFEGRAPEFDLGSATGLALSPDGRHIYATGGSSLTAMSRDPGTGAFSYIEAERDGVDDPGDAGGTVQNLALASGVAISPDGGTVYATARIDAAISAFERDPATGRLSLFESERNGINDPDDPGGQVLGMSGASDVTISSDGTSVYVASEIDDSVIVFERDASTGALSFLERETDGGDDPEDPGGAVGCLDGAAQVVVAPGGKSLYAVSWLDDSVAAFARDEETGEISFLECEEDGVDDAGDAGGTVAGLAAARSIAVAPGGKFVYAAGQNDNALAMFEREASGELSFVEAEVNGVEDPADQTGPVSGMRSPLGIAVSPNGLNAYVAGSASDSVATFRIRPAQSEIAFIEAEESGVAPEDGGPTPSGLDFPREVAVSPDESHVYLGTDSTGLALFGRSPAAAPDFGRLGFLLTAPGYALREPQRVAVSPDGRHLVVSTQGDDSLRSLARNPLTGSVSHRDTETEGVDDPSDDGPEVRGLEEPRGVAFAPNGRDLYVSDAGSYSVSHYLIDPDTGELTYRESEFNEVDDPTDPGGEVRGLYEAWDLVLSPDGTSVYSAGNFEGAVAAFRRAADGSLSFIEAEVDGVDGVEGLEGVKGLAVSPDGTSLYAAAYDGSAVAAFARDPATGALAFLETEEQGADDPTDRGPAAEGLSYPHDVVVSRDGRQVYVGGEAEVTRLDRDPDTGRIAFAEVEREEVDDPGDPGGAVGPMREVQRLELSRDGHELYVTSTSPSHALTVFARSPQTGALSYLETERHLVDDPTDPGGVVEGLRRLQGLDVSPDDRHLYAVSEETGALALFSREDDFDAPETTITAGPGEGEVIASSTPAFSYESSESPSTFDCQVDGTPAPCRPALGPLSDGPHTFSVAATDQEGNTDPSPASRSFTVDTLLSGGKVRAGKKQRQKRGRIAVKLTLTAAEPAEGTASGNVLIGRKSYRLKPLTRPLRAGEGRVFSLSPTRPGQRKKIVAALERARKRPKVTAKLTATIVDRVGNRLRRNLKVRLLPPKRTRR